MKKTATMLALLLLATTSAFARNPFHAFHHKATANAPQSSFADGTNYHYVSTNNNIRVKAVVTASAHFVSISFTPPPDANASTTYSVLRGTTAGGEGPTPILTGQDAGCSSAPCAPITDATATVVGQTYFYQLTATTGGIVSAVSNEASAKILPFAPVITGAAAN